MSIKRYLDWRGYFEGLYLSWVKTLTTTLIAFGGSNASDYLGLHGVGLNWKQGLGLLGTITFWEIVKYVNAKPKPEIVTETTDTTTITKP